jgi:CRP-like cAMP-binding protein
MAASTPPTPHRSTPSDLPVTVMQLREIGLFGALSDDVLTHLATTLKTSRVQAGDAIFREGDGAREMYVVLEGEVEVLKKSRRGRDMRVAILGPNDGFGEMSLIDVQPRSATVRVLAPTRLLRMTSEDLDALYRYDLKSYALITLNIARDLSRRLRVTDGILADFTANVLDEYVSGTKG